MKKIKELLQSISSKEVKEKLKSVGFSVSEDDLSAVSMSQSYLNKLKDDEPEFVKEILDLYALFDRFNAHVRENIGEFKPSYRHEELNQQMESFFKKIETMNNEATEKPGLLTRIKRRFQGSNVFSVKNEFDEVTALALSMAKDEEAEAEKERVVSDAYETIFETVKRLRLVTNELRKNTAQRLTLAQASLIQHQEYLGTLNEDSDDYADVSLKVMDAQKDLKKREEQDIISQKVHNDMTQAIAVGKSMSDNLRAITDTKGKQAMGIRSVLTHFQSAFTMIYVNARATRDLQEGNAVIESLKNNVGRSVDVIASSTGAVQKDGIENAIGAMMDSKQVDKLLKAVQQAESNRSSWIKQARDNAEKQAQLTQKALETHEQVMLDLRIKAAETDIVLKVVADEPAQELQEVPVGVKEVSLATARASRAVNPNQQDQNESWRKSWRIKTMSKGPM